MTELQKTITDYYNGKVVPTQEEFDVLAETVRLDGDGATQSSVTRRALKVFNRILKKQAEGGKIIFEDSDGSRETLFIL